MAEFFLEKGRYQEWLTPPVEGEILFRVIRQPRLSEPNLLPYIWTLLSVEKIEDCLVSFKGMAESLSLSEKKELLVDIFRINAPLEEVDYFSEGNQSERKRYLRTNEFEVTRFLAGAPIFLKINRKSLNIDPWQEFLSWEKDIVLNSNLLPESRAMFQRSCHRVSKNAFGL